MAESTEPRAPELSIIVPVHNGAATLRACLQALLSAPGPTREFIVVDDGSRDESRHIAESLGVRTLQLLVNLGDGDARNIGVKYTTAPIVVFVDADVVIHRDALQRISRFLSENPDYSAVFGSYDSSPNGSGLVNQYRNLLHHFTHQAGKCEAETFWTGLGAIRRSVFESMGGFQTNRLPDVALGLDLFDAGYRIKLDKKLLGTHLKVWTFRTMVLTDVLLRALPWSEIILSRGRFTDDLNTSLINRLAVCSASFTILFAIMSVFDYFFFTVAGLFFVLTLLANTHVFKQFWKERGMVFSIGVIPLHFVHQLCSGLGFVLGITRHYLNKKSLKNRAADLSLSCPATHLKDEQ
jgi:glycosyltransferase involved in cell wall biosynthesis